MSSDVGALSIAVGPFAPYHCVQRVEIGNPDCRGTKHVGFVVYQHLRSNKYNADQKSPLERSTSQGTTNHLGLVGEHTSAVNVSVPH
jgi:hypothetical protein